MKQTELSNLERLHQIEELVLKERKVSVDDLAKRFAVSTVTIRKDLSLLEDRGRLLRTHGGAIPAERPEMVIPLHRRSQEHVSQKEQIARAAALRIREGESVVLDTGSTTLALAKNLRGRNVNVVTNSVLIAIELATSEDSTVVVLGGTLRRSSLALMNTVPHQLKSYKADRSFMGASGFDPRYGFSCQNLVEAETKRAMMKCAQEVVLLVDSSKFAQAAFAPFCGLKDVHCVITDAAPPKFAEEAMKQSGVKIVVAGQDRASDSGTVPVLK